MRYTFDELARLAGLRPRRLTQTGPVRPNHDLLALKKGDLFFPMHAHLVDEVVLQTLQRVGAAGIVLREFQKPPAAERCPDLAVLTADSPPEAYFKLAAGARTESSALVTGITGSSGKSSTKAFLAHVLGTRRRVHATRHSRNLISDCAGILLGMDGTPDEAAVIEMAFGAVGAIGTMTAMAKPQAGIITKITHEHLDAAGGSWERLIEEKGSLGLALPPDGVLAVHAEDPGCNRLVRSRYPCPVLTFGEGPGAHMRYEAVEVSESGTVIRLRWFGREMTCRLQTFGRVQAANAAAAALVGHVLGYSAADIQAGLEAAEPLPRRFQIFRYDSGLTLVDDTFSANTDNVVAGLEQVTELAGDRRRVAVLAGVAALGDEMEPFHLRIGRRVAELGFDTLLLLDSEGAEAIARGAREAGMAASRVQPIGGKEHLADAVLPHAQPDTVIYCKGSMYLMLRPPMDALRRRIVQASFQLVSPPPPPFDPAGDLPWHKEPPRP